jgi:hypothetical protein
MAPLATVAQNTGANTAKAVASVASQIQRSEPVGTTTQTVTVTTAQAIETEPVAAVQQTGNTSSLTKHAGRKKATRHHLKVHASLIERLAREQVSARRHSNKDHSGK